MAKHRIKIASTANGAISVHHDGNDTAYCEAEGMVIVTNQPTAGWGLSELHYTDADGNVTPIVGGSFEMPHKDVTVGGTFKRFALSDWAYGTGNVAGQLGILVRDWQQGDLLTDLDVVGGLDALDAASEQGSQGKPVTAVLLFGVGGNGIEHRLCYIVKFNRSYDIRRVTLEATDFEKRYELIVESRAGVWSVQSYTEENL